MFVTSSLRARGFSYLVLCLSWIARGGATRRSFEMWLRGSCPLRLLRRVHAPLLPDAVTSPVTGRSSRQLVDAVWTRHLSGLSVDLTAGLVERHREARALACGSCNVESAAAHMNPVVLTSGSLLLWELVCNVKSTGVALAVAQRPRRMRWDFHERKRERERQRKIGQAESLAKDALSRMCDGVMVNCACLSGIYGHACSCVHRSKF